MANNEEQHFIKEKIKDKPLNKKKMVKRGVATTGFAILFGFVSCLVFCVTKPVLERLIEPEQEARIEIPRDTCADDTAADKDADTAADGEKTADTEADGDTKTDAVDQTAADDAFMDAFDIDAYQKLQDKLYQVGAQADSFLVTVTGITESTDIFDLPYEATGQALGVIVGNNGRELLVLTEYREISEVKAIEVTLMQEKTVRARLKQYDAHTGIAVVSVPLKRVPDTVMERIQTAVLGNSLNLRRGRLVVALGAGNSILTGNITSVGNTVSIADWNYTVFTTNIVSNGKDNGILINTDGEIVGLLLQGSDLSKEQNMLTAVSISELKTVIERLSNGQEIPYIGIRGNTVTEAISQEYDIPKGVYIKEVLTDSPAMEAGLQNGDVIAAIDGNALLTMDDYQRRLLALKPQQRVEITVRRQTGEKYKTYTCTAEVGVMK